MARRKHQTRPDDGEQLAFDLWGEDDDLSTNTTAAQGELVGADEPEVTFQRAELHFGADGITAQPLPETDDPHGAAPERVPFTRPATVQAPPQVVPAELEIPSAQRARAAALPTVRGTVRQAEIGPVEPETATVRERAPHGPAAVAAPVAPAGVLNTARLHGGVAARVQAGVEAARLLHALEASGRTPTATERTVLAHFPGWGATPQLFDEDDPRFAAQRAELKDLWSEREWKAARRTILNAHYTDPAYVRAVWDGLAATGFTPGDGVDVLEPGCGMGGFFDQAPAGVRMHGVELDGVTARLARVLHPAAEVRDESFADTRLTGDGYDAVIGNVPFGDFTLYDPAYNKGGHSIHNHFILKALRMTKPGGVVAVITSRYTLDSESPAARQEMAAYGQLLGAVRMPARAHRAFAGTDVVTDVLLLRRYRDGETPDPDATWVTASEHDVGGQRLVVNDWIFEHQAHAVLGTLTSRKGRFGPEVTVAGESDPEMIGDQLSDALTGMAARALEDGSRWETAGQIVRDIPVEANRSHDSSTLIGHLGVNPDGSLWAQGIGGRQEVPATGDTAKELRGLVKLRDAAETVLDLEAATTGDSTDLDAARRRLNRTYDAYQAQFGAINRFEERWRKPKNPDDEDTYRRVYPKAIRMFRDDPAAATVLALEDFNEETKVAAKAPVFTRRVLQAPPAPASHTEDIKEALWVSLDQQGSVDLPIIARMRGVSDEDARRELGDLVFPDPEADGKLVTREEYLSGNVRAKRKVAIAAADGHPEYRHGADALQEVLPQELGPAEIQVKPGAVWVPLEDTRAWVEQALGAENVVLERVDGRYKAKQTGRRNPAVAGRWAVHSAQSSISPVPVIEKVLNAEKLKVTYTVKDRDGEHTFVDQEATDTLAARAEKLTDDFQTWLWSDKDRAERLQERYNDLFNGIRLREYPPTARRMPGLTRTFTPRPHQWEAVNRIVSQQAVGLFHEVGAGKTAEMAMGAMELRRLGMAQKPAIVVPNQLVEQFTREFKQIYPAARVLTASSDDVRTSADSTKDRRRLFVAKAAMGDWDAIIITQSAFGMIQVGDHKREYLERRVEEHRQVLEAAKTSELSKQSTKRMEDRLAKAEESLKKLIDHPLDPALSFERTGIDYLFVDEAHGYKNLEVQTNIDDLACQGSKKAEDLNMKLWYLRDVQGRSKVATLATATPVANNMVEMYTMLRYLSPALLEAAQVDNPSEWARQFTDQETVIEQDGSGGFKQKLRTTRFVNLPELLKMWQTVGDTKRTADLGLDLPLLKMNSDGVRAPQIMRAQPTEAQDRAVGDLARRADLIKSAHVDPKDDNILKIFSEGRSWALDPRLMDPTATPAPGEVTKIDAAAQTIHDLWAEHKDQVFTDPAGAPQPITGGLQLVFCDRGTPTKNDGSWNAYDALRDKLVALGVPAAQVRFVHEAATDEDKARLFQAARAGKIAVLIGSTDKMGTGVNVQQRAVALHHLDCPWRPADITQREGRIIRQGNRNPEVQVYRWVTAGSFDGFMWESVSRKAKFIGQVTHGQLDVRELDDEGAESASFAAVAAIAAGDMRIMDKMRLDQQIKKLDRQGKAFNRNLTALDGQITAAKQTISDAQMHLSCLKTVSQQLEAKPITGPLTVEVVDERPGYLRGTVNGDHVPDLRGYVRDTDWKTVGATVRGYLTSCLTHTKLQHLAAQHAWDASEPWPLETCTGFRINGIEFRAELYRPVTGGTIPRVRVSATDSLRHSGYLWDRADHDLSRTEFQVPTLLGDKTSDEVIGARIQTLVAKLADYEPMFRRQLVDQAEQLNLFEQQRAETWPDTAKRDELVAQREALIRDMTGETEAPAATTEASENAEQTDPTVPTRGPAHTPTVDQASAAPARGQDFLHEHVQFVTVRDGFQKSHSMGAGPR